MRDNNMAERQVGRGAVVGALGSIYGRFPWEELASLTRTMLTTPEIGLFKRWLNPGRIGITNGPLPRRLDCPWRSGHRMISHRAFAESGTRMIFVR